MAHHESIRLPRQERSQKRVAQILDAARKIIEVKGAATMTVSEVAETAGVTTGSIYQYFPNKSAIIAALARNVLDRQAAQNQKILENSPQSLLQLLRKIEEIYDGYLGLYQSDPVMWDVWAGFHADKSIRDVVEDDDVRLRDLIFDVSGHLFDAEKEEEARRNFLILFNFGNAALNLAAQYEADEAHVILDRAKTMLVAAFEVSIIPLGRRKDDLG